MQIKLSYAMVGIRNGIVFGLLAVLGLVIAIGELFYLHSQYSFHDELHHPPPLVEKSENHHQSVPIIAAENAPKDGTFNGLNIAYRKGNITSSVHCVGENYQADSWMYRSCDFRNLCFDTEQHEFVLFRSSKESALYEALNKTQHEYIDISTTSHTNVSLGGINPKWVNEWDRMKWFPQMIETDELENVGYYELPLSTVWIPFHSLAGFNPGHLVWDDFLPIFTLLSMFSHVQDKRQPLMMRKVMRPYLWATCDNKESNTITCRAMFRKFLPIMGINPDSFSTFDDFMFNTTDDDSAPRSKYVCARHGVAGIGMLTDHGTKLHGWSAEDYKTTHNHGRGAILYQFRNFVLTNLGIPIKPVNAEPPLKITFSVSSSARPNRNVDMKTQMDAIRNAFPNDTVIVQAFKMSDLSMAEQVKIAAESTVYVTVCGGGAVTGIFLPRGSSLIVFYDEKGSLEGNRKTGLPARLDWDVLNNAAYLRTHWFPTRSMSTQNDIDALVELIRYEIDLMRLNQ